jgi:hypothetical protein
MEDAQRKSFHNDTVLLSETFTNVPVVTVLYVAY